MGEKPRRLGALELFDTVLDEGSWRSWDQAPVQPTAPRQPVCRRARRRGGEGGDRRVHRDRRGHASAGAGWRVIAGEFRFLAGSIGSVAAERIVLAFERAMREELPLFAAPSSGGTRMQEGTPAFVGMVKISAACQAFKAAGLPYLVYLRHPTTGGVFASWGSLGPRHGRRARGDGRLPRGPRLRGALRAALPRGRADGREPLRARAHRRRAARRGARRRRRARAERAHGAARGPSRRARAAQGAAARRAGVGVDHPLAPRGPARRAGAAARSAPPTCCRCTAPGRASTTPACSWRWPGSAARPASSWARTAEARPSRTRSSPKGLRVARRGMRLAHELGLPLVSVIDTAGAALSKEAEEGGMAGEIARCLAELVTLDAPTLCVLLGQGTGGGALAVMPADRVICAQHSWLSPLPPGGRLGDPLPRAPAARPSSPRASGSARSTCSHDGIVDRIVAEHPDAADEPEDFCLRMSQSIQHELGRPGAHGRRHPAQEPARALPPARPELEPAGRTGDRHGSPGAGGHGIHLPTAGPALGRRCQRGRGPFVPRLTP